MCLTKNRCLGYIKKTQMSKIKKYSVRDFSDGSPGKESVCNAEDSEDKVQSLGWEDPWRKKWQPTPVFLA